MGWGTRMSVVAAVGLLAGAPSAIANTITVNTTADAVANDGTCSLREAITAANLDSPSGSAAGECAAGGGPDTIILPASATPYLLTRTGSHEDGNVTGDLDVSSNLTIQGAGAGTTTIDGNAAGTTEATSDRVFDLFGAATITISGVTITDGRAPRLSGASPDGGGVLIAPGTTVTLNGDRLTGNAAGRSDYIDDSGSHSGIGGAIDNAGTLTVLASTIDHNQAGAADVGNHAGGSGGGIANQGTLIVRDSTIAANTAGTTTFSGSNGGAGGSAGGLYSSGGTVQLLGSTVSGNHAGAGMAANGQPGPGGGGGGLMIAGGTATMSNDTLARNVGGTGGPAGAGIPPQAGGPGGSGGDLAMVGGTAILTNVTVADGSVGRGGSVSAGSSPQDSAGPDGTGAAVQLAGSAALTARNSIIADPNAGADCAGTPPVDGGHNLSFGDSSCPATFASGDPKLGTLSDNGGPTETLALGPGSAAIDAVPATGANCPATDQRAVERPQGGACDIGAYELGFAPVNTAAPRITGSPAVGAALACSVGTWTNFPSGFAYGWRRDGAAIPGASTSSYTAAVPDAGHTLVCAVSASNSTGSTTAVSAGVAVPAGPRGGPPPGGAVAPQLSRLRLAPSTFRAASRGASLDRAKRPPVGTTLTYRDSAAATTTFTVLRRVRGVRRGRGCVAHGHGRACARWVAVGSFRHVDRTGAVRLHFTGRLGRRALAAGTYRLTAIARLGRRHSAPLAVGFRVVH